MEEVEAICDHVAIIDAGRVLRQGALTELLSDEAAVVTVRQGRSLEQLFMHLTSRSLRD
jgi:ABC-type multidrug transport system ATPase subunit